MERSLCNRNSNPTAPSKQPLEESRQAGEAAEKEGEASWRCWQRPGWTFLCELVLQVNPSPSFPGGGSRE